MTYFFLFVLFLNPVWSKIDKQNPSLGIESQSEVPEGAFLPYKFTKSFQTNMKLTPMVHILKSVFVGVDGRYSLPNSQTPYNYGPVLGIQFRTKVPARMWIGPNISYLKVTGYDGYRIGAGVRVMKANINLEFLQNRLDSLAVGSESKEQMNTSSMIFSLSFFL